jgi:hypothetical protein
MWGTAVPPGSQQSKRAKHPSSDAPLFLLTPLQASHSGVFCLSPIHRSLPSLGCGAGFLSSLWLTAALSCLSDLHRPKRRASFIPCFFGHLPNLCEHEGAKDISLVDRRTHERHLLHLQSDRVGQTMKPVYSARGAPVSCRQAEPASTLRFGIAAAALEVLSFAKTRFA